MISKSVCTLAFVMCAVGPVHGQVERTIYKDDALGVAFAELGAVERVDSTTYRITLQSSGASSVRSAQAQVSASDRLFVDLPGSYGGRLYLDEPTASRFMDNRVLVDSVTTGYASFRREYWAVYAGMGMWDCVINCSAQRDGHFYIVSLIQDRPIGKPGEEMEGKPLSGEALKAKVLTSLRDTTDVIVNKFDALLASVQIHNDR